MFNLALLTTQEGKRGEAEQDLPNSHEGDKKRMDNDDARQRVDQFLASAIKKPMARGRLIFALDATGSREPTWDSAVHLQAQMFHEVATLGSLDMQLVYFRGTDHVDAECKASGWMTSPMQLAAAMTKVKCLTGLTQIRRVLDHALRETTRRKVDALAYVGDACEEPRIHLVTLAEELGRLKVPVFMFQEDRDREATAIFPAIAEASHGAYRQFDSGSARQLAELLKAVATFATGGIAALERKGSGAARLLLGQLRSD